MSTMPRQVLRAPQIWKLPNNGNTIPGKRVIGDPTRAGTGMGMKYPHRFVGIVNKAVRKVSDKGGVALANEESEEAAKRWEALGRVKAGKSRAKFVKEVRVAMNANAMLAQFKRQYKTTEVRIQHYYGARKQQNNGANFSTFRNHMSANSGKMRFFPHQYNRRLNPEVVGKNPTSLEEGEEKYGWKSRNADPFLREGPRTQVNRAIDVQNSRGDGKYFKPAGVGEDLAKWFNSSYGRKQQTYLLLENRLKGTEQFHYQVGAGGRRQKALIKWYKDLFEAPLPRNVLTRKDGGFLKECLRKRHKPGQTRSTDLTYVMDRNIVYSPSFDAGSQPYYSQGFTRLSRPDYS